MSALNDGLAEEVNEALPLPPSADPVTETAPATPPITAPPSEELPREKLDRHGPGALADAEVLALFFGTGTKGLNVIEMSRLLLATHGSLTQLSRLHWKEIALIPGIGEAKAKHLTAAFELGRRLARQTFGQIALDTPGQIAEFLGPELRMLPRELIRVVLINARLRYQHMEDIAAGTINACTTRLADILRPAIVHQAHGFILAHNHPSGDPHPSEADRQITRQLRDAAHLLGLRFFDHVIVGQPSAPGGPDYFSFKENGML